MCTECICGYGVDSYCIFIQIQIYSTTITCHFVVEGQALFREIRLLRGCLHICREMGGLLDLMFGLSLLSRWNFQASCQMLSGKTNTPQINTFSSPSLKLHGLNKTIHLFPRVKRAFNAVWMINFGQKFCGAFVSLHRHFKLFEQKRLSPISHTRGLGKMWEQFS